MSSMFKYEATEQNYFAPKYHRQNEIINAPLKERTTIRDGAINRVVKI